MIFSFSTAGAANFAQTTINCPGKVSVAANSSGAFGIRAAKLSSFRSASSCASSLAGAADCGSWARTGATSAVSRPVARTRRRGRVMPLHLSPGRGPRQMPSRLAQPMNRESSSTPGLVLRRRREASRMPLKADTAACTPVSSAMPFLAGPLRRTAARPRASGPRAPSGPRRCDRPARPAGKPAPRSARPRQLRLVRLVMSGLISLLDLPRQLLDAPRQAKPGHEGAHLDGRHHQHRRAR